MPYALARPALRAAVGEHGPSANERSLIDNVTKRVRMWKDTLPYYSEQGYDEKTPESRGTESVLNAFILANHDAQRGVLSGDTRAAFDIMWTQQQQEGAQRGSWLWLQFDQEPWEAKDSVYYGAALAAIAVGNTPGNYAASAEIQQNLNLLRDYLKRESASQSTINRVFLLWASTKLPGLLDAEQQRALISEALNRQQSDGGWSLAPITWTWSRWSTRSLIKMWLRADETPLTGKSDGIATGLIAFVLQEAGVPTDNIQLQKGLAWLMSNQATQGYWPGYSVNKRNHQSANTRMFMSDAGTAYAVLALTRSQQTATHAASFANR